MTSTSNNYAESTISILLATDCHLGYYERDPIRGDDSLSTFEEVLKVAQMENVDMILLGGDLFHDNKPSRETLMRTMELMRKYCMGPRPCALNLVSDQRTNFPRFGTVNYMDPNYNVAIPIFSIHGNHDDPTGEKMLCALDLLSAANFVNYFGKAEQPDDITVSPVCITKGHTKLAIYGLGNIRDDRLHRTFLKDKVKWVSPTEDEDSWFNLLVIHQNRVKHGEHNYIPETFIPDWMQLVFWGHEHKCEITPALRLGDDVHITQPGSTVATSLSEGEAEPKHCGILRIRTRGEGERPEFKLSPIALKTVRPYSFKSIMLSDFLDEGANERVVEEFLASETKRMIKATLKEVKRQNPSLKEAMRPLIRLRVEYTGFPAISVQRFGQQFADQVANSRDILLFYRQRTGQRRNAKKGESKVPMPSIPEPNEIEDLVTELILRGQEKPVAIRPTNFKNAIHMFVNDNPEAFQKLAEYSLSKYVKTIMSESSDVAKTTKAGEDDTSADDSAGETHGTLERRVAEGDDASDDDAGEEEGRHRAATRVPKTGRATTRRRNKNAGAHGAKGGTRQTTLTFSASSDNANHLPRKGRSSTRSAASGRKQGGRGSGRSGRLHFNRQDGSSDSDAANGREDDDGDDDDDDDLELERELQSELAKSDYDGESSDTTLTGYSAISADAPRQTRRAPRRQAAVRGVARRKKTGARQHSDDSDDDSEEEHGETIEDPSPQKRSTRRTRKKPKRR